MSMSRLSVPNLNIARVTWWLSTELQSESRHACDTRLSQLDGHPNPALRFLRPFVFNGSSVLRTPIHTVICRPNAGRVSSSRPSRVPVTSPLRVPRPSSAIRCQSVFDGLENGFLRDAERRPTTSGSSRTIFRNRQTD